MKTLQMKPFKKLKCRALSGKPLKRAASAERTEMSEDTSPNFGQGTSFVWEVEDTPLPDMQDIMEKVESIDFGYVREGLIGLECRRPVLASSLHKEPLIINTENKSDPSGVLTSKQESYLPRFSKLNCFRESSQSDPLFSMLTPSKEEDQYGDQENISIESTYQKRPSRNLLKSTQNLHGYSFWNKGGDHSSNVEFGEPNEFRRQSFHLS